MRLFLIFSAVAIALSTLSLVSAQDPENDSDAEVQREREIALWGEEEAAIPSGAWRRDLTIFQLPKRAKDDKTGLRNGDKVVAWNGTRISTQRELARGFLTGFRADEVTLTISRNMGTKSEPKPEEFDYDITLRGFRDLYGQMAKGPRTEYKAVDQIRPLGDQELLASELEERVIAALRESGHAEGLAELKAAFKRMTEGARGHWLHDDVLWLLNNPLKNEQWARRLSGRVNTSSLNPEGLFRVFRSAWPESRLRVFDFEPESPIDSTGMKDAENLILKFHSALRSAGVEYESSVDSRKGFDTQTAKKLRDDFRPLWDGSEGSSVFEERIVKAKYDAAFNALACNDYGADLIGSVLPGGLLLRKLLQLTKENSLKPGEYLDGNIIVLGLGNDTYTGSPQLLIDLGGDDTYRLSAPYLEDGTQVSQMVIDLSGDDTYIGDRCGLASGNFSVSVLIDMAGDDTYHCDNNGMGFGLFGIGILYDHTGHDRYEGDEFTMGVAFNGVGLLIDREGNDRYNAAHFSQGVGLGGGVGGLIDFEGEDIYSCTGKAASGYGDEGEYSGWGQGVGFGFRGLTAGGIGMLIDHEGRDIYRVGQFGLGCGYWWGVGLVHDRSGDDIYECSRYGLGSGAHYGVGIVLDDEGDDIYTAVRRSAVAEMASTWDLSVGTLIDSAGDDMYRANTYALGGASQTSYGIFWDKAGNDIYSAQGNGRALGYIGSTDYGAGRGAENLAVFVDSAGNDTYRVSGRGNGQSGVEKKYGVWIDVKSGSEAPSE